MTAAPRRAAGGRHVNGRGAREVQQAAERGPTIVETCHSEELSATVPKVRGRHQVRQQRLARRHREGAGDAEQRHDREHGPRAAQAAAREREQQQRAEQQHGT